MKRIQLFEFEDFNWFPDWIRSSMTNLIIVLHKMVGTKEVISNLLTSIRKEYSFAQVVDIGAGSGGIMPEAVQLMNATDANNEPVSLLLTDLHPNAEFVAHINKRNNIQLRYQAEPLDASNLTHAPKGLKTMVNSFHHMPPKKAKQILKSAQENKEALLIYEIAENKIPLLVWWVLLPLSLLILFIMALFMTPFSKPITLKQIIFTYLIPVIPIFYAWDGQASMPRTYTFDDINKLLDGMETDSYTWKIDSAKKSNGKKLGYYILGLPKLNTIH